MDRDIVNAKMLRLMVVTMIVCWIIKICGSTIFEIPFLNIEVNFVVELVVNLLLNILCWVLTIMIVTKRKLSIKECAIIGCTTTFVFIISLFIQMFKLLLEIPIVFSLSYIFSDNKQWSKILKETIFIFAIITLLQIVSMSYRGLNINSFDYDFTVTSILSIDFYIVMLVLTEYAIRRKGVYLYEKFIQFILGKWKHRSTVTGVLPERESVSDTLQENCEVTNRTSYKIFLIVFSMCQFLLVFLATIGINWLIGLFVPNTPVGFQFGIIFVVFVVMRAVLGNSYHSNMVGKCTTVAIITFTCATQVSLPTYVSVQVNVFIGFLVAFIMYKLYTEEFNAEADRFSVCRGMDKEQMVIICDRYNINGLSRDIMIYFYCDRHKVDKIAFMVGYSNDNVAKLKKQALDMIK